MSVRSSLISSLQQIPPALVWRTHLDVGGVITPDGVSLASMGHTGGFFVLEFESRRREGNGTTGTTVGVEEREPDDEVGLVDIADAFSVS